MQENITDDPSLPVRRIYDQAADQDSGDSDELPQFDNVRTRLKRCRQKFVPPIPTDIDDVHVCGEWSRTRSGRPFLSHLDNDWGVAIFTTKRFLKALYNSDCVFIDGTFRTAPHPYAQFVTIHGLYNGFVVPVVFCLLTGKTIGHYRQVLQHVKSAIRRLVHRVWKPQRVVVDFEQSLMIAVHTELPLTIVSGCYFHFCQSLWRNVQNHGLSTAYRQHRRVQDVVRKVMALAFLPVLLLRQNFFVLRNSRRTQRLCRRMPEIEEWLDYVQQTYIDNNATFPAPVWNVYQRDLQTRTNNHLEGRMSYFV